MADELQDSAEIAKFEAFLKVLKENEKTSQLNKFISEFERMIETCKENDLEQKKIHDLKIIADADKEEINNEVEDAKKRLRTLKEYRLEIETETKSIQATTDEIKKQIKVKKESTLSIKEKINNEENKLEQKVQWTAAQLEHKAQMVKRIEVGEKKHLSLRDDLEKFNKTKTKISSELDKFENKIVEKKKELINLQEEKENVAHQIFKLNTFKSDLVKNVEKEKSKLSLDQQIFDKEKHKEKLINKKINEAKNKHASEEKLLKETREKYENIFSQTTKISNKSEKIKLKMKMLQKQNVEANMEFENIHRSFLEVATDLCKKKKLTDFGLKKKSDLEQEVEALEIKVEELQGLNETSKLKNISLENAVKLIRQKVLQKAQEHDFAIEKQKDLKENLLKKNKALFAAMSMSKLAIREENELRQDALKNQKRLESLINEHSGKLLEMKEQDRERIHVEEEMRMIENSLNENRASLKHQEFAIKSKLSIFEKLKNERHSCAKRLIENVKITKKHEDELQILKKQFVQVNDEIRSVNDELLENHFQLQNFENIKKQINCNLEKLKSAENTYKIGISSCEKENKRVNFSATSLEVEFSSKRKDLNALIREKMILSQKQAISGLNLKNSVNDLRKCLAEKRMTSSMLNKSKLELLNLQTWLNKNYDNLDVKEAKAKASELKKAFFNCLSELNKMKVRERVLEDELNNVANFHDSRTLNTTCPELFNKIKESQNLQRLQSSVLDEINIFKESLAKKSQELKEIKDSIAFVNEEQEYTDETSFETAIFEKKEALVKVRKELLNQKEESDYVKSKLNAISKDQLQIENQFFEESRILLLNTAKEKIMRLNGTRKEEKDLLIKTEIGSNSSSLIELSPLSSFSESDLSN